MLCPNCGKELSKEPDSNVKFGCLYCGKTYRYQEVDPNHCCPNFEPKEKKEK